MPIDPEREEHRRKMLKSGARYLAARTRLRAALLVTIALIDEGVMWAALSSRDKDNEHWGKVWRRPVKEVSEGNAEAGRQGYLFQDHRDRLEGGEPPGTPPLE